MRTLLLPLFVLAAACGGPLDGSSAELDGVETDTDTEALAGRLTVRVTDSLERPRWKKRFDVDDTLALYVAAELTGPGPHQVAFELYEPEGNVYQRNELTFDGPGRAYDTMPIAGTWVQLFGMTGRWRVKVFLDGAEAPAGAAAFDLR